MERTESAAAIADMAASYEVTLDERQVGLLVRHLEQVREENERTNLTRIVDWEEALVLHVLDSLLLVPFVPMGCDSILDIGSGAGFPGMPLAIATGVRTTLTDAVGKKTSALQRMVETLGLESQVKVLHTRIEDLARERPESFSLITARAVSSIDVLVEYAAPLLETNGSLLVTKGPKEELTDEQYEKVLDLCGMRHVSRETFELPHGLGTRVITRMDRVEEPRIRLPRRAGMALKRPLRDR